MNASELNAKFAITGKAAILAGPGGIPVIHLASPDSTAKICLLGAHVMSWQPNNAPDVLWMSSESLFQEGKAIRGGIPVCWPWFSKNPLDETLPMHGFARIMLWDVESINENGTETTAVLALRDTPESHKLWDYAFYLKLTVTIGKTLTLALTTENTDSKPFSISQALHTYYNVGDIVKVNIDGFDGLSKLNKVNNGAIEQRNGTFIIDQEVDEIYENATAPAVIHDTEFRRAIRIDKQNSSSSVVWNPWIAKSAKMPDFPNDGYKTMLCVETANVLSDARTIQPGQIHTMTAIVSIDK